MLISKEGYSFSIPMQFHCLGEQFPITFTQIVSVVADTAIPA